MPEIDLLVVANHAEAQNGLLYLSGACWTDLWRPPAGENVSVSHFGVGVAILVGWDETNRRHHLTVRLEDDDGSEIGRVDGDLEMGRPPGISPGSEQRTVLAINFDISFPRTGGYRIVAEIEGRRRNVAFRVHDQPLQR